LGSDLFPEIGSISGKSGSISGDRIEAYFIFNSDFSKFIAIASDLGKKILKKHNIYIN
jgi:hypothetical protein